MNSDQIGGIIRAILGVVGGIFVTKGWVSADTLSTVVGVIVAAATAGWSAWTNKPGTTIPKAPG